MNIMRSMTPFGFSLRFSPLGLVLLSCLMLSACNKHSEMFTKEDEIEYAEGERNPRDVLEVQNQRDAEIKLLIDVADQLVLKNEFDKARKQYSTILKLDPHNLRATQGLERLSRTEQHDIWLSEAKQLMGLSPDKDAQASEIISKVLSEDPNNSLAKKMYREVLASNEERRLKALKTKLAYKEPVSLEFRDTDFKVIIEALSKGTGVSFTLDGDIKRNLRASLFVKNVSLEDALDMLTKSNKLRMKVLTEDSVLIYPDKTAKVKQYQDLVIRTFYLEYAEPAKIVELLRSMLGLKNVQLGERVPFVMIKDVPEIMPLAEKLIIAQDVPEPEVMLEMQIIEVRRTATEDLGVRWPTSLSVLSSNDILTLQELKDLNSSAIGVAPNPALLFGADDAQANLLSNPRLRVKNGDTAKIHIGDQVPIITSNVSSTGTISENVQYIDVGLKLEAEPTINLGGDVNIKINLTVSNLGESTTTSSGSVAFQIGTRSATTQLRLKDGETQVLAGLISDVDRRNINKVPGLGDSVVKRLFSNSADEKSKTELVLSITPHIIRHATQPDSSLNQYWVGSELDTGNAFTRPNVQEDAAQLFTLGNPPQGNTQSAPSQDEPEEPSRLNFDLPDDLSSDFGLE